MDSLGVADKRPLYISYERNGLGGNLHQNEKNSQTKIASAHIHILRNNPAKFQNYLIDSLGVADKGPLYIYQRNGWGSFPPKMKKKSNS